MVVTFTEIRLRALSNCGHYRAVDIIVGDPTLSQKYDCGHYRIVGTIAGDLTQSQEYDDEHFRDVDSIAEIRLWALSECGHYRTRSTRAVFAGLPTQVGNFGLLTWAVFPKSRF